MENLATEESLFIHQKEQVKNRSFKKTPQEEVLEEINRARRLEKRLKSKIVNNI